MPFTLHFDSRENKEIFNSSILAELAKCSNANEFTRIMFDIHFNQPVENLPKCIKHVQFGHEFNSDISNIGEHIETLIFEVSKFNYDLATFPKGLKYLKIAGDILISQIKDIPIGLEKLSIQYPGFNSKIMIEESNLKILNIISHSFDTELSNLPASLINLYIISSRFNQPVNNLPAGLKSLKINCRAFNQRLDNLPSGLKDLILEDLDSEIFNKPLNNLPQGLELLDLHLGYQVSEQFKYIHTLEHLPNSIRKLRIANYWGDLNTIPDSVEILDLWFPPNKSPEVRIHIKHWYKKPTNLKVLEIHTEMAKLNRIHDFTEIIKQNFDCIGLSINGNIC